MKELFLILLVFLVIKCIKVVPVGYEWVVEVLGKRKKEPLKEGIHFLLPGFNKIRAKVSMKEQFIDILLENTITKDNIKITLYIVVFYKVVDSIEATYSLIDIKSTIIDLIRQITKNIVKTYNLDQTFSSRDRLNNEIRENVELEINDKGCWITRVEIKKIKIPEDIRKNKEMELEKRRKELNNNSLENSNNKLESDIWCKNFKSAWQNKNLEKLITLFSSNITYYKDSNTRLYSITDIKEEWQEIFGEDYTRIDYEIICKENKSFVAKYILDGKRTTEIIFKVDLDQDGLCKYINKWGEIV